jgi:hypothetical protein
MVVQLEAMTRVYGDVIMEYGGLTSGWGEATRVRSGVVAHSEVERVCE